jgi:hypothetical protein
VNLSPNGVGAGVLLTRTRSRAIFSSPSMRTSLLLPARREWPVWPNRDGRDRQKTIHCGPWTRRRLFGGFWGTAVIHPFESVGKSSADEAAVRIAANFIAREWWLTKGPYDLIAVDPSPTLENRKLDAVGEPVSEGSQVSALSLAQRSLIDDARQSARRSPLAPLCKESGRCVDDRRVVVIIEYGKDRRDGQLHEGKLLLFESARVDAAFSIESENGKRVPNDAHRVSVHKLDRDAGHSYSLLRKNGQTVACRIPQHPVEPGA